MKQETSTIINPIDEALELSDQSVSGATGSTSQTPLRSIFKRAYKTLQNSANDYQQNASLKRKTMWAINDKSKFLKLIAEIKGFNDSLASLFPDVVSKTADTLRNDIQESEEIRSLVILQEASADDHLDISDSASDRLERLGATATDTHTILAGDKQLVKAPPKRAKTKNETTGMTSSSNEVAKVTREESQGDEDDLQDVVLNEDVSEDVEQDEEVDELTKQFSKIDRFVDAKQKGMLTCSVYHADWSAHCHASVYWQGETNDRDFSPWADRDKGFITMPHDALGITISFQYLITF